LRASGREEVVRLEGFVRGSIADRGIGEGLRVIEGG
jgi:hypothetical protein